jgi:hypothetical protein
VRLPAEKEIYLPSSESRLALELTEPHIPGIREALSSTANRPGREAGHSPPRSAKTNISGAILPLTHMPSWHTQGHITFYPPPPHYKHSCL